jgi:general secretion pathway protein E
VAANIIAQLPRPQPDAVAVLPYFFARQRGVIAWCWQGGELVVLVRADSDAGALNEARRMAGKPVAPKIINAADFEAALGAAYNSQGASGTAEASQAESIIEDLDTNTDFDHLIAQTVATDLMESQSDAPIVKLINALLTQAVRDKASDLHIEVFEGRSQVRFRIDGVLREVVEPKRSLHAAMVSRIKVMAGLDIAEKRLPQDGRMSLRVAGRAVDVRVSTLPTGNGERVVLRLLDKQASRLSLEALGMARETQATFDGMIGAPHGIILVTGPTGSGKTTTLYAALSRLDRKRINIMTVEDPIEYEMDGIAQTQINPRIEMDFARALRSILRQDPDCVMIGEIRDFETAQIAVQASLTGHLVLATLHTNDAASAVTRLIDMGIEPFLLASSLTGVLAQRLVRELCDECKQPSAHEPGAFEPKGCPSCNHTGYKGRTGIYELLTVNDAIKSLIHERLSESSIRHAALAGGMRSLRDDGERWIRNGSTSRQEVTRATIG